MASTTVALQVPSRRLANALAMAAEAGQGQFREGTRIPYISHPMAVASLVIECGGTEGQVIAGLLCDTIEDDGGKYASRIHDAFGPRVLALVEVCSDGAAEGKANAETSLDKRGDWKRRKYGYLAHFSTGGAEAMLVTVCEKLHDVRSAVADLQTIGPALFGTFAVGREGTLWYYSEIDAIYGIVVYLS